MGWWAWIRFTIPKVVLYITWNFEQNTFNVKDVNVEIRIPDSFNAEWYDDWMINVSTKLLSSKFEIDNNSLSSILTDLLEDDYAWKNVTSFDLTLNMYYDEVIFGWYVRWTFNVGDIVADKVDYEEIELCIYTTDNWKETFSNRYTDVSTDFVSSNWFYATEEFLYFYKDVFDYNGPEKEEIFEFIRDCYDSELEEAFETDWKENWYDTKEAYLMSLGLDDYLYSNAKDILWENHWDFCREDYGSK